VRTASAHQYIDRETGRVVTEQPVGDRAVRLLYSHVRENAPRLFRALTSRRVSQLLAYWSYDNPLGAPLPAARALAGVDLGECLDPPDTYDTLRKLFQRRIRYWSCRPIPDDPRRVVAPADACALFGSLRESSALYVKHKFFAFEELLGGARREWLRSFAGGDYALLRLTPGDYHWNHVPVAGRVVDFYVIDGGRHSCNPSAVLAAASPYSKNRRAVTVIDSDCPGGTGAGLVAMVEVVALMVGEVQQCYSDFGYDDPRPIRPGLFVRRGAPKSVFLPGSSTDIVLFEPGRVRFDADLLRNQRDSRVRSRFQSIVGGGLVETRVRVRSSIGRACG